MLGAWPKTWHNRGRFMEEMEHATCMLVNMRDEWIDAPRRHYKND